MQDEALYKCRLLLFEDPGLEALPRHEVADGVGRSERVAQDTVGPSARFIGVHRFEDPVGTTAIAPNCGPVSPKVWYVMRGVAEESNAIPLRWGIVATLVVLSSLSFWQAGAVVAERQ